MENQQASEGPSPRRQPLFLLGALLCLVGPVIYSFQVWRAQLVVPWYLPALATIGVLAMGLSVVQRRGVWRIVGFAVFVLLCAFEWVFFLVLSKTPAYAGPGQPGRKLPEFAATYADGKPFSDKDLQGTGRTVMLFFRGRW
jgi:hypothetical protein